jgi:hypothetical protein
LHKLGGSKNTAKDIFLLGEIEREKCRLGKFGVGIGFRSLGIALGQQK